MTTAPRERGKTRQAGEMYLEVDFSSLASPFQTFLLDPPKPVNLAVAGIGPGEIKIVEIDGVHHVFDVIAFQDYPNVLDFVEEARKFGISRHILSELDVSKLTHASRLFLIHPKAFIVNIDAYADAYADALLANNLVPDTAWHCPMHYFHSGASNNAVARKYLAHLPSRLIKMPVDPTDKDRGQDIPFNSQRMCIGLWRNDIVGGELCPGHSLPTSDFVKVTRRTPSVTYEGWQARGFEPQYCFAIFGCFPISRIAVVAGGGPEQMEAAREMAGNAQIPVDEVGG